MPARIQVIDALILLGLLTFNIGVQQNAIRFGAEMGDIAYVALLQGGSVLLVVLFILKWKGIWDKSSWITVVIGLAFLLFIAWETSYGRGPEYPWDGTFWFNN